MTSSQAVIQISGDDGPALWRAPATAATRPLKLASAALMATCAAALFFPSPLSRQDGWARTFDQPRESARAIVRDRIDPASRIGSPILDNPIAEVVSTAPLLAQAMPFRYSGSNGDRVRAAECLAAAAWYEIGTDRVGQRAVIQTVINRVNHPSFPKSVCGVVFQGSQRRTGCQFTFTCDGSLTRRRPSPKAWHDALIVAEEALNGYVDRSVGTATHYHADYVVPWWSSRLQRLATIGPHIFYRWSGSQGRMSSRPLLDAEGDFASLARRAGVGKSLVSDGAVATADAPFGDGAEFVAAGPGMPETIGNPATAGQLAIDPGVLSDVGERLHRPQGSGIDFVQLDAAEPSGRWAIGAMAKCPRGQDCRVVGYSDAGMLESNRNRPGAMRDRPDFIFVRDARSGMDIALWNCDVSPRSQPSQCMPRDGRAVAALLAER